MHSSTLRSSILGSRFEHVGHAMLRYGLVAILLMIGLAKWTPAEAEAIRPWVTHSPFLSWLYGVTSVQGGSIVIGCFELVAAALIAVRRWFPTAAVAGSALAAAMFVVTISFLFTTPNQSPDAQGFLLKDFFLLATAIWSAGEALRGSSMQRV